MSTLPNEMPHPINAEPNNTKAALGTVRINTPIPITHRDSHSIFSIPCLSDSLGATGENTANINKGMVVIRPASVFDRCRASCIWGTTGPTLVIGARRLVAIRSEEHTSELQSREKLVCR